MISADKMKRLYLFLIIFVLSSSFIFTEKVHNHSHFAEESSIDPNEVKIRKIFDFLGNQDSNKIKVCETYDSERANLIQNYINQNKDNLSEEDVNLIKFIASDCLPVVLYPGFYANKFQFQITNCTAINLYHPEIALACGFDKQCVDGHEEMFWLSENFETDDGRTCFGQLGKFNLKKNETESDPKKKFYEEVYKGFKVTYWGNTPQTEKFNECGFGASTNLLDKRFYFGKKSVRGMLEIKNHFLNLGYKLGVNLFSVPFDWRRTSSHDYNFHLSKQTVDLAYNITGKPSVLIAHSYGSLIALNYIYSIPKEEKQEKVSRLITVGPPFAGANKSIKGFIIGFEEMNIKIKFLVFKIIDLYFSIQNQKIMLYNTPAPYEMFPKFFWNNHKDDEWMTVVRNRAKAENRITKCVRNYFKDKYGDKQNDSSFYDMEKYLADLADNFEELNGRNSIFLDAESKIEDKLKYHEVYKYKILNSVNIKVKTSISEDMEITEKCIDKIINESTEDLVKFRALFPFFPDLQKGCGNEKVNDATCLKIPYCKSSIWDTYCRLNFNTPLDQPLVEIKDGEDLNTFDLLTKQSITEMIKKYGMATPDLDFVEYVFELFNKDLQDLNHPGVPVTIYYSDFSMTAHRVSIPDNPKKFTDQDKLVIDELGPEIIQYDAGDGTVPTSNAVMPGFKWSLVKEDLTQNSIHLISYCTNPDFSSQEIKFEEHQYMNVKCECKHPSSDACSHSSMIGDANIIQHITKYSVNSRNRLDLKKLNKNIDLISKGVNHIEKGLICSNLKKVNEMFAFYD